MLIFLAIIVGIPLYLYFFQKDLINEFFRAWKTFTVFLRNIKLREIFFYIGAQALQIIICIIPGQWLQFGAGYVYGFWLGYLFSLIGALVGTVLTYYIAKVLGHDAMHLIFGEEKFRKMVNKLKQQKSRNNSFLYIPCSRSA